MGIKKLSALVLFFQPINTKTISWMSPHIEKAAYDYYDGYWSDYWERLYDKHGMKQPEQGL